MVDIKINNYLYQSNMKGQSQFLYANKRYNLNFLKNQENAFIFLNIKEIIFRDLKCNKY